MAKRRKKPASTKYILGGIAALIVICSITLVLVAVKSRSVYAEDPTVVAQEYANHMNREEYAQAYQLFTPELRDRRSPEKFASLAKYIHDNWKSQMVYERIDGKSDTVAYADYLPNDVTSNSNTPVRLVRDKNEGWRIDGFELYFTLPTPAFGQCLASQGAVLYGAQWSPHYEEQIRTLGPASNSIPKVDCDQANCQTANIETYPTWKFRDGTRAIGVQTISDLQTRTGCKE